MEGYSILEGLYYRFERVGEEAAFITEGDSVYGRLSISSVILDIALKTDTPCVSEGFRKLCFKLSTGDSVSLIFGENEKKYWNITDENAQGSLVIDSVFSEEVIKERMEMRRWRQDAEMNEMLNLRAYLFENKISEEFNREGVYLIPLRKGKGISAIQGSEVRLHYTGRFLNGELFEDTYSKSALQFQPGKPDQVIRGFELALPHLQQGGKYRLIIPSTLAFGAEGSSTHIVPPYTTLIYEVEVVDVL
jgi:FKBP-type peptidyl-prolyl cis-trans isomerase